MAVEVAVGVTLAPGKSQLELEKLQQEVRQLKIENDKAGSIRENVLAWAPFLTVLVAVAAVILPVRNEVRAQRRQRERDQEQRETEVREQLRQQDLDRKQRESELEQRRVEAQRRFDDLFAQAVANLGGDRDSVKVSAAVALHNFLRPEYQPFHEQVYSVVCANLAVDEHSPLVIRFLVRAFAQALPLHLERRKQQDQPEPLDFARCRMPRVDLHGLDLSEADLAFATLSEANLRGSILFRARGFEVDLTKANLSGAVLSEVRLNGAACGDAHFHNAQLISAELRRGKTQRANLQRAEFFGAKMQGAHLDDADLRGARFDNANVSDTFFEGATFDEVAVKSLLKVEVVKAEPSWKSAHLDADIRDELERRHTSAKRRSAHRTTEGAVRSQPAAG
jgi:uncharacterized protein YjbI with pentapeptide repeats